MSIRHITPPSKFSGLNVSAGGSSDLNTTTPSQQFDTKMFVYCLWQSPVWVGSGVICVSVVWSSRSFLSSIQRREHLISLWSAIKKIQQVEQLRNRSLFLWICWLGSQITVLSRLTAGEKLIHSVQTVPFPLLPHTVVTKQLQGLYNLRFHR